MTTIPEILDELEIPFKRVGEHRHATEGWIQIDCPFCGKDSSKFHLGIGLEYPTVSCWRCGIHDLIETLTEASGQPPQVITQLVRRLNRLISRWNSSLGATPPERRMVVNPAGLQPLLPVHEIYLKNRGFDPQELVNLWGLQGIGLAKKLAWRIYIPITHRNKTVSWTTRATSETAKKKYWNASPKQEIISLKSVLFGHDYARNSIIVCEGPFDVFRIGPGAVATLGLVWTHEQLLQMSKYPKRVICFDNEEIAQKRAEILCKELSVFPGETYRVCLSSKDPGEASKKEINNLRREFLE